MHFVMHCPGMPFHGASLEEGRSLGGSESAAYYLARELARQGHQVTVFTSIPPEAGGSWEGVRYLSAGAVSERAPLGADFEWYAAATPHDVLIMQRVPDAFRRRFAAKVNLWWSHDLALKRHQPRVVSQLWNVDRVLAVSRFHRNQIAQVYDLPPGRIAVLPNGVDPALQAALPAPGSQGDGEEARRKRDGGVLVYSSRPERGLELLVGPDGLMERLLQSAPELTLRVAGYDNTTPHMRPLYQYLWDRCAALPNVELLGALSKKELADLMRSAWLQVYPTTFEEVSCITAMEAQAAGTPVVTASLAALPETLAGGGAVLLEPAPETLPAACEQELLALRADPGRWEALRRKALEKAPAYSWRESATGLVAAIERIFAERCAAPGRLARHLIRHSDLLACRRLLAGTTPGESPGLDRARRELARHCGVDADGNPTAGDEPGAGRQSATKTRQDPNDAGRPLDIPRFQVVEELLAQLPPGSRVLEHGCGDGHLTCLLAARFPELEFHGVDADPAAIEAGRGDAERRGLANVRFTAGDAHAVAGPFDCVLACQVLERVPKPGRLVDALETHLSPGGRFCITVPYGPWEAEGEATGHPRTHLHHFERADLLALFGHKPDYRVVCVPVRFSTFGEAMGAYRVTFGGGGEPCGKLEPAYKLAHQAPRETLSVCMICGEDGQTLARTLESVRAIADQIVIGIDGGAARDGMAWRIAERYGAETFPIETPLETGFADARNSTLERADGDWVLWIDDDEVLEWPERLDKYLRPNGFDAYAVKQHHYAVEPEGVIKTDFPCRLFRRRAGLRFFGLVHEHPEVAINEGPGRVFLLPDVAICHSGYETEAVRRRRFFRNLPLMVRDREAHPGRVLGKFLWIRDLAHLNRYALERGEGITAQVHAQAEESVALWRELLREGHLRMALDALPYYSEAVELLRGEGIAFEVAMGASRGGLGDLNGHPPIPVRGRFLDTADIRLLTESLMTTKTAIFEEKYF